MLKVALTGNIASGKSAVLQFFKRQGIPTIDSDAIVRRLYRKPEVKAKVSALFHTLGRKAIAGQIFSDAGKKAKLEGILHPLVIEEIRREMHLLETRGKKLVIVEVPLLFEARLQNLFDKTIVVFCSQKEQLSRLLKQGLSRKEALQRIESQMPMREKVKKADFAIDNSKSLSNAFKQAGEIMRDLDG